MNPMALIPRFAVRLEDGSGVYWIIPYMNTWIGLRIAVRSHEVTYGMAWVLGRDRAGRDCWSINVIAMPPDKRRAVDANLDSCKPYLWKKVGGVSEIDILH